MRFRTRKPSRTTPPSIRLSSRWRRWVWGPVSNSVTAAIAIAAAAAAALALIAALLAWLQLKRVRSSQQVMLGGGKDDLVDFAVSLQARIDDLHRAVDEVAAGLARAHRGGDEAVAETPSLRFRRHQRRGGQRPASVGPP